MVNDTGKAAAARRIGAWPARRLLLGAKIALSVLLLGWILSRASLADIWAAIEGASVPVLVAAYALHFLGLLVSTTRWRILLRAQGVIVAQATLLKSYIIANFFNNFLPSTVGGDASRGYDCYRFAGGQGQAVSSVLVDRLLGLLVLVAFAVISLPFASELAGELHAGLWLALGGSAVLAVVWGIFFAPSWPGLARLVGRLPPRLGRALGSVIGAFRVYRGQWRVLLAALALSVVLQGLVVLYFVLVAEALDLGVAPLDFFLIVPLALFVMMLPISINGLGLREGVLALLLTSYGVALSQAVALAWLVYLGDLGFGVLGGIVYACRR